MQLSPYNNFGTPMLGDPVTCAFAPHALTYLLFPDHVAMLLNRVLVSFLTLVVLLKLFGRLLPPWGAFFACLFAFLSPAFVYFVHHHPHQTALLYYALVIWRLERHRAEPTRRNFVWLWAASLAFFIGAGINAVIFGVPFVLLHALLGERRSVLRFIEALVLPFFIAGLMAMPRFLAFLRWALLSARSGHSWEDVASYSTFEMLRCFSWLHRASGSIPTSA